MGILLRNLPQFPIQPTGTSPIDRLLKKIYSYGYELIQILFWVHFLRRSRVKNEPKIIVFGKELIMANYNRDREDDWARQVRWERGREEPYRDYGWEPGESALPEFRDLSVHIQPYERQRVSRWRNVQWDQEYNYGTWDMEGPYVGVGPKNYQRSDDRIFEDVCERLTRHGQVDARGIEVDVNNGEVTLQGTVNSRQAKRMAEDAVQDVFGVKDVNNQLKIQDRAGSRDASRAGNRDSSRDYQRDMGREQDRQAGRSNRESGRPGGGQGRVDEVGGSGVYPASGPYPKENAETQGMASWGQGERGAEGYQDHGDSEVHPDQNEGNEDKEE
jgi:hypothetical protein